jgi:hypothetical protein
LAKKKSALKASIEKKKKIELAKKKAEAVDKAKMAIAQKVA